MNPFQRRLLWSSSLLTGITGLVYFWMKYAMEATDPWAVINHPLQPWVLKAHILVAPVMVFSVGLIGATHIWRHYAQRVRVGRRSGLLAMWVLPAMVMTGYLVQAVTHEGWLVVMAWTHIGTGSAYLASLVLHHRVFRTAPMAVAPSRGRVADPVSAGYSTMTPEAFEPRARNGNTMSSPRSTLTALLLAVLAIPASAQQAQRATGPVIQSGGAVFEVSDPDFPTRMDMEYRIAFEVADASPGEDQLNASLNTVARFLNMHAGAGIPRDRIHAAVVVHGAAGPELLDNDAFRARTGRDNPNVKLVEELLAAGVQIVLCGQTQASRNIPREGLIDGVQVALSAITALYTFQTDGYQVNPW
ncbi:MAG: DsrE family protein [Gemmatimonadota bacterium]|nr:DsrE family protein [Gemmatimonadota bacterium]